MEPPEGFTEFVTGCSQRLLRSAWLLTGDTGRAEDLLQTVLAKAWQQWSRIDDDAEAYVRRMLFNTYVTWWRRRWRTELPTASPPDHINHRDVAMEIADRDVLNRALAGLSRQQRAILVLRFFEDLSVLQTADLLGCSAATVKTQTARGLAAMRADVQLKSIAAEEVSS